MAIAVNNSSNSNILLCHIVRIQIPNYAAIIIEIFDFTVEFATATAAAAVTSAATTAIKAARQCYDWSLLLIVELRLLLQLFTTLVLLILDDNDDTAGSPQRRLRTRSNALTAPFQFFFACTFFSLTLARPPETWQGGRGLALLVEWRCRGERRWRRECFKNKNHVRYLTRLVLC